MYTLYTTALSANGRKVLAQALHLGLEPIVHHVDVYRGEGRSPAYLAINPTGRIPTLVENGFALTESNAILQYVSEAHADSELSSRDARERAIIASWLFWESAHWQPVLSELLAPFVGHALLPDRLPVPAEGVDWASERLAPLLDRLETHLEAHPFLALDRLTIADFSIAGMLTYFRAAAFPFETHPRLTAWYGRLERLDAWRQTEVAPWKST